MSETRTTTTLTSTYPSSAKRNGDLASFEERVAAVRDYFASPRFDGIIRLYTARQVVEQQGSAPIDFQVARARQAVHDVRPAAAGALQIAAALSICTYLLPDVLKRFQAAYPKVMITVRSGHSKEVLDMVLRGEAEIGLARSLHHPAVETLSLREDPLVLVARAPSIPQRQRRARLDEVAEHPLIFFDRGSSDWTLTHGLFRRAGLVPNVAMQVEAIETAKRMVERGIGLAFLPHIAVARDIRRRRLTAIDIVDAEPLSRSLDVIHPRHRPLSSEARALLAALRAAVREVVSPGKA
jgi:DNA-binding transcriptional LysR family regulator